MDGWQPIETAPKDGTPVLLYGTRWRFDWSGDRDANFAAVCSYMEPLSEDESGWSVDNTVYYTTDCLNPVAWMPLPVPPIGQHQEQEAA